MSNIKQNIHRKIKVRFPPSPTGEWHFGNVRTFVFNYLFAKKNNGEIVLRFEDTDNTRNKEGADEEQMNILKTLNMTYDEGPYYQSKRKDIYTKELKRLLDEKKAYEAEENQAGTGKVIRIKNPEKEIIWNDLVKGQTKISSHSFKDNKGNADFIIARSVNDPLYHFAVVVDDWLMDITHVLRGEDHVTSTPRQIIILESLGAELPVYGHFPTILGENKKKLGKRNGAVPVREYLEKGYLADALLNAISLLGWNPGTEQEIFTQQELIEAFSLDKVQHHPAVFHDDKLNHINKEHLHKKSHTEFKSLLETYIKSYLSNQHIEILQKTGIDNVIDVVRERMTHFGEIKHMLTEGDLEFIYTAPVFTTESVNMLIPTERMWKNGVGEKVKIQPEKIKNLLTQVVEILEPIESDLWNKNTIKDTIWSLAEHEGKGLVLWPLRVALSGKEKSPDPFTIAGILGKKESIIRLINASKML